MTEKSRPEAVVTGATSGIGKAIAEALAGSGYDVLAVGRNESVLSEMAQVRGIEPLVADFSAPDGLFQRLENSQPAVLVNNAGMVPRPGPFESADMNETRKAIDLNLTVQLVLTHAVLPGMIARGFGHIFFTGSIAGHGAYPDMAVYAATKAAIGGFTQSLRKEVFHKGVRITEIVAGRVETGLYRSVLSEDERSTMYSEGNEVQPGDVARMVMAVLNMPRNADVVRFDILPGTPVVKPG